MLLTYNSNNRACDDELIMCHPTNKNDLTMLHQSIHIKKLLISDNTYHTRVHSSLSVRKHHCTSKCSNFCISINSHSEQWNVGNNKIMQGWLVGLGD